MDRNLEQIVLFLVLILLIIFLYNWKFFTGYLDIWSSNELEKAYATVREAIRNFVRDLLRRK